MRTSWLLVCFLIVASGCLGEASTPRSLGEAPTPRSETSATASAHAAPAAPALEASPNFFWATNQSFYGGAALWLHVDLGPSNNCKLSGGAVGETASRGTMGMFIFENRKIGSYAAAPEWGGILAEDVAIYLSTSGDASWGLGADIRGPLSGHWNITMIAKGLRPFGPAVLEGNSVVINIECNKDVRILGAAFDEHAFVGSAIDWDEGVAANQMYAGTACLCTLKREIKEIEGHVRLMAFGYRGGEAVVTLPNGTKTLDLHGMPPVHLRAGPGQYGVKVSGASAFFGQIIAATYGFSGEFDLREGRREAPTRFPAG